MLIIQGRIKYFLIGGSKLQRGFRFVNFSWLIISFPDFSEIFHENEIILIGISAKGSIFELYLYMMGNFAELCGF